MTSIYDEIPYASMTESPQSFAYLPLAGIARKVYNKVRPSSDFPELPQPSTDLKVLQKDFMKYGYCLVKDALSKEEIEIAKARLLDQAEAECVAKVAHVTPSPKPKNASSTWKGTRQLIANMPAKGDIFRKIATFRSNNGDIIEQLMNKILGRSFLLSSQHGVIVEEGGGGQELHQDQSGFPFPHPPYPLVCNIIYMYTEWNLENGGTYVVPGSHLKEGTLENNVDPNNDYTSMIEVNTGVNSKGVVALCAPPGTCFVSDGRVLHSGATRRAPGQRLGNNCYYCHGRLRQQENASVQFTALEKADSKLLKLLGIQPKMPGFHILSQMPAQHNKIKVPVEELSMQRPSELKQDFDWYYTNTAKGFAKISPDSAMYKGPGESKM